MAFIRSRLFVGYVRFGSRLCKNVKLGGKTNCGNDLVSCGVLGWAVKTHGLSLKFSVVE